MLPGEPDYLECPRCKGGIIFHEGGSGNTIGAVSWSDGKVDAPMLHDYDWLVKCPFCHILLWQDELYWKSPCQRMWSWKNRDWEWDPYDYESYEMPTIEDYFFYLKTPVENKKKERHIREMIWWVSNDPRRNNPTPDPLTDDEIKNLNALYYLLDESDPESRIMKIEIKRELGLFDEAISLLDFDFPPDYAAAVAAIVDLIINNDPFVKEILCPSSNT